MLERSLFELASATCFCGGTVGDEVRKHLLSGSDFTDDRYRRQFRQECLDAMRRDLDTNYPRRFRLNDMHITLDSLWPTDLFLGSGGATFHLLDNLFAELFVEHGDVIHYRDEQVQAYARCAAQFDPSIIVGWHIAKRLRRHPIPGCHDLERIINAQRPFFCPPSASGMAYAENHVHLGGVHYDGLVLLATMTEELTSLKKEPYFEPLRQVQRLARGLLANPRPGAKNDDKTIRKLCVQAFGRNSHELEAAPISWGWLANEQPETEHVLNPRWQRRQIARSLEYGEPAKAWLWFIVLCWSQYQDPDCGSSRRMAIFYLFNRLMRFRRELLMDGQGLTRFVELYNAQARWHGLDMRAIDAAKRIFGGPDDVAEIKITRAQFDGEHVAAWINSIKSAAGLANSSSIQPIAPSQHALVRQSFERWHFCIHFLRIRKMKNKPALVWKEAESLSERLRSMAGWERPELMTTSTLWEGRLRPSRWVRSLDVAGDENAVTTEIYASPIRWLRSGLQPAPMDSAQIPGLYLSIHAGEDYAHPVSGMRHIDETVRFCEMRAGDRLGHALAIGIPPKTWLARQGETILELDEYFDNLVWLWHYACEMSTHVAFAVQLVPKFERTIRQLAPLVGWLRNSSSIGEIGPDALFKAWQLRRNCYHYADSNAFDGTQPKLVDEKSRLALPDLVELKDPENKSARLYKRRWNFLTSPGFSPAQQREKNNEPVRDYRVKIMQSDRDPQLHCRVNEDLRLITIVETSLEVEFMHALQDWLIDHLDRHGIVIETNPTSNVYIGRFTSHAEHPIFRWYPPDEETLKPGGSNNLYGLRRGPFKLCINTDDPGIMPTTLRTEYALLREAAITHGVSRTKAEAWLERIRQFGLAQFHQKHEPLWA